MNGKSMSMSRVLKFIVLLFSIIIFCLIYGFFIEPKTLKTRHVSIPLEMYSGPPIRAVLLSDIHMGGMHVPAKRIETIVKRVNILQPDIILIPGDFINGHLRRSEHSASFNSEIEKGLAYLAQLNAPMGRFVSVGNHDVWYDATFIETNLSTAEFTVLRNQAVNLPNGLCIVGLADHDTQHEDPKAFNACKPKSVPIALMHSPDSFPLLHSDTALAVAGHTHGGQINIPFIGRRITATAAGRKYAYGKLDINGIPAFVTAGIGTSILPARFRSPPEIDLIELRPR